MAKHPARGIRGPVFISCRREAGVIHVVAFMQDGDVLVLSPEPRFTHALPVSPPFAVGDVLWCDGKEKTVVYLEAIPPVAAGKLDGAIEKLLAQSNFFKKTARVYSGFRYRLKNNKRGIRVAQTPPGGDE